MKFCYWILFCFFTLGFFSAQAQQSATLTKVLEKFTFREANNPSSTLFLHCDKTLYTNNETIWFAAYLQANRGTPLEKHHTLSIALLHTESKKIELSELYVMEAGLASGSVLLPDTIVPGNYQLLAYTNIVDKKGMPFEVFAIPLTIKSTVETKFNAAIRLLDTAQHFKGSRRLSIRASGIPIQKNGKYPPANISYYTAAGDVKTIQTNGDGEAIISLAANALTPLNHYIYASVSYEKETKHLTLALPVADPKKVHIKFYPEGGNLSDGIASTIGWETSSAYGQPLSIKAVVLKDSSPIDTVETSVSGMGSFKLMPTAGSNYTLKVFKSNLSEKDTVYQLPKPINDLPIITIPKAITTDTLSFTLKHASPQTFGILVHNTHELLASFNVVANARGVNVKIALKDVPKGVTSLTVLDTLGNPLAERLFFAHYTDGELLRATTDKAVYKPREKVTLKLRLKETVAGKEEVGLVSVAAVQGNRIETSKFRDMESYTYLEHELGNLPLDANGTPYRNRKSLEDLLLIKGWRKFVFDEKNWAEKVDTAEMYKSLELSGWVTKNGKELDESVNFTLLRDTLFDIVNTDNSGYFKLNTNNSSVTSSKKLLFMLNKENRYNYQMSFKNPFKDKNYTLSIPQLYIRNIAVKTESNSFESIYKGTEKQINLKAIEIKGNRDDLLTSTKFRVGPNKCGDFVCEKGTLNCPVHPSNVPGTTLPVKGKIYRIIKVTLGKPHISSVNYQGCIYENSANLLFVLDGRKVAKEFYVNDYKIDDSLNNQSTIYWSPFLQLNSTKDTEVSFYTSDLKAPYRVIVQGLSEKQVVTGTTAFKVE
jgi:hypothetical protein